MRAHAIHHPCGRGAVFMHEGPRGRHRRQGGPGFGPGFGPGGFFGPPGRKAGRGDIRAAILALLAERPMHGYQIIREIAERSEGVWRPSPGSVYPTLQQLEDEELVRPAEAESGKRVFELTDAGREEAGRQPAAPWEAAAKEADDDAIALRELVGQVMMATRQVAQAGTAAQLAAARDVLRDARRRLYRILADDEEPETPEA